MAVFARRSSNLGHQSGIEDSTDRAPLRKNKFTLNVLDNNQYDLSKRINLHPLNTRPFRKKVFKLNAPKNDKFVGWERMNLYSTLPNQPTTIQKEGIYTERAQ